MRFCFDCQHFRPDHLQPSVADRVRYGRCVRLVSDPGPDPVTGAVIDRAQKYLPSAASMRAEDWFLSILTTTCGKCGRWFSQKREP